MRNSIVTKTDRVSRRRVLLSGAALIGGAAGLPWGMGEGALAAAGLRPTPRQSEGPFYPDVLPLDRDNDLVTVEGRPAIASGRITHVFGRVRDANGRPVRGARIEVWQCDTTGRYIHTGDARRAPGDPNFQGYGRAVTDDQGSYRFRTIKPVPYAARAPHIHFAIKGRGFGRLITQMYIKGEPRNAHDFVLNRIWNKDARRSLIVPLRPAPHLDEDALMGQFDIVLGG